MANAEVVRRVRRFGLGRPYVALRDEIRNRLRIAKIDVQQAKQRADAEAWDVFRPAVERLERAESERQAPAPIPGMPPPGSGAVDPEYSELDRSLQIRDGLLWLALEVGAVVRELPEGTGVELSEASTPPPNQFALSLLEMYCRGSERDRAALIGRAIGFAPRHYRDPEPDDSDDLDDDDEGGFLHEIGG